LRRHPTKPIYPNHRLPPDAPKLPPRDRSNRLLGATNDLTGNSPFHELNSVAEWIRNVDSQIPLQGIYDNFNVVVFQVRDQAFKIHNQQGRVCLLSGSEICFDAQVDLQFAPLKPSSAALRQVRRFGYLGNAENTLIEFPWRIFPSPAALLAERVRWQLLAHAYHSA
jgi:hypothetical protein